MKRIRSTAVLLICNALALILHAESITLLDGRVLKAAKIVSSDPASLMIVHSSGAENVPFSNLPEYLKAEYGYSSEAALDYKLQREIRQLKQAEKRQAEQEQEQLALQALLVAKNEARHNRVEETPENYSHGRFRLNGKIISITSEGILVSLFDEHSFTTRRMRPPIKPYRSRDDATPLLISEALAYEKALEDWEMHLYVAQRELISGEEVAYLVGHPFQDKLIDGNTLDVYVNREGSYKYKAVSGAAKTVGRYRYLGNTPFDTLAGK